MQRRLTALIGLAVLLALPAAAEARAFPRELPVGRRDRRASRPRRGRARNVDRGSDWYAWHSDPAEHRRTGASPAHRVEDGPGFFARWRHDVRLAATKLGPERLPARDRVEPHLPGVDQGREHAEGAGRDRQPSGASGATGGSCSASATRA